MDAPRFNDIVNKVCAKSPLNRKKLIAYLETKDDIFFKEAEVFAEKYTNYLNSCSIPLDDAVDAYLEMNRNMMLSQIDFMKTGKYPVQGQNDALHDVYENEVAMKSYMIGLAISQFLWATHYEMYRFHYQSLLKFKDEISSYLEIGPGHGLFLSRALDVLQRDASVQTIDISPVSIEITKSIISFFHPDAAHIKYINGDYLNSRFGEKFNFITMGEVLEHVNEPKKMLVKTANLLDAGGRAYISTCVNAPAIDHVYHFKHVDDIRQMINECGLEIENELVLPVENLEMDEIVKKKIAINYCALLKHK